MKFKSILISLVRQNNNKALVIRSSFRNISVGQTLRMDAGQDQNASEVFQGVVDHYRGVTVRSKEEPCELTAFAEKLEQSLKHWKSGGNRCIWFHVHISDTEWVPVLAKHGFNFHHTKEDQVAMMKWLPDNETANIPSYAHHNVGVGGMVVNDKDELLVIKEKQSFAVTWKLPGGYVDPGEHIHEAAMREVLEETGVKTRFKSIVAFRQAHNYNFGCSDLYIITHLEPTEADQALKRCEREVAAVMWVPIQEYLVMDEAHKINKFFVRQFLDARERGFGIGLNEMELKLKTFRRKQNLYSIQSLDEKTDDKDNEQSKI